MRTRLRTQLHTGLLWKGPWLVILVLSSTIPRVVYSQEIVQTEEFQLEQPQQTFDPVFPPSNPDIIFIEAEEAIATTFATGPILNFGASGKRALQLNRFNPIQGGSPFFSDYVFFAETPGEYELWYGGTPPGPQDDLFPSRARRRRGIRPQSSTTPSGPTRPE